MKTPQTKLLNPSYLLTKIKQFNKTQNQINLIFAKEGYQTLIAFMDHGFKSYTFNRNELILKDSKFSQNSPQIMALSRDEVESKLKNSMDVIQNTPNGDIQLVIKENNNSYSLSLKTGDSEYTPKQITDSNLIIEQIKFEQNIRQRFRNAQVSFCIEAESIDKIQSNANLKDGNVKVISQNGKIDLDIQSEIFSIDSFIWKRSQDSEISISIPSLLFKSLDNCCYQIIIKGSEILCISNSPKSTIYFNTAQSIIELIDNTGEIFDEL